MFTLESVISLSARKPRINTILWPQVMAYRQSSDLFDISNKENKNKYNAIHIHGSLHYPRFVFWRVPYVHLITLAYLAGDYRLNLSVCHIITPSNLATVRYCCPHTSNHHLPSVPILVDTVQCSKMLVSPIQAFS